MGSEKRKEERNASYAKAILLKDGTPGYLRDLSSMGCHIAFVHPIPVRKEDALLLQVLPEKEFGIPAFKMFLEVLWIRKDEVFFSVGGRVSPLPGREHRESLDRLYKFYARRAPS